MSKKNQRYIETIQDSDLAPFNFLQQSPRQKKIFLKTCTPQEMQYWNTVITDKQKRLDKQRQDIEAIQLHDRVQRNRKYQQLFSQRQAIKVSNPNHQDQIGSEWLGSRLETVKHMLVQKGIVSNPTAQQLQEQIYQALKTDSYFTRNKVTQSVNIKPSQLTNRSFDATRIRFNQSQTTNVSTDIEMFKNNKSLISTTLQNGFSVDSSMRQESIQEWPQDTTQEFFNFPKIVKVKKRKEKPHVTPHEHNPENCRKYNCKFFELMLKKMYAKTNEQLVKKFSAYVNRILMAMTFNNQQHPYVCNKYNLYINQLKQQAEQRPDFYKRQQMDLAIRQARSKTLVVKAVSEDSSTLFQQRLAKALTLKAKLTAIEL